MKFLQSLSTLVALFVSTTLFGATTTTAVQSFTTPYTISHVEVGKINGTDVIFGSSYYGTVICMDYFGNILWENALSGYYNQDISVYDIDEDGSDEVVVANADGSAYCVDDDGALLWSFKANDVPFNSICVMRNCDKVVIVVGGYDLNFYCLTPECELLQEVATSEFTSMTAWGDVKDALGKACSINFLRPIKLSDGKELLGLLGSVYTNSGTGCLHMLDLDVDNNAFTLVKEISPIGVEEIVEDGVVVQEFDTPLTIGHMEIYAQEGLPDRMLFGGSGMIEGGEIVDIDMESEAAKLFAPNGITGNNSSGEDLIDDFGYRVSQPFIVKDADDVNGYNYFFLFGSRIIMLDSDMATYDKDEDIIIVDYSFNDACIDEENNYIFLASAQSGGNCIHKLDINNPEWRDGMRHFVPPGNISQILEGTADIWTGLNSFVRPSWESSRPLVIYQTESKDNDVVIEYEYKYPDAQCFYDYEYTTSVQEPSWRDTMSNATVAAKRDTRQNYVLTQDESIDLLLTEYKGAPGASYSGGHGNDPHFFQFETWEKMLKTPAIADKSTVLVFAELTSVPDEDFDYTMRTLFMPLASLRDDGVDVKIGVRSKDIFWISAVYLDPWAPLLSGEYSGAFIPSMEETTCKTMELSLAGRVGLWAAGCVEQWGTRCARDNPSYDRLRQDSHQMLPNHFLRMLVYHLSLGARYLDNFAVDQEYMSLLWEMVGKGLLYVPKKDEIVSISPVHLAMKSPHPDFYEKGENVKWTIMYGSSMDCQDNFVFDRLRATWSAAAVTDWDYSRYAAGVIDRRLNFLPPYSNGLVVVSPGEDLSTLYRAPINEQLHPLYHDIMSTYYTDGKDYYVNGVAKDPTTYYKTVEEDIIESAKKLPLNVEGENVAWVAAQSASNHIRVTLIDGGYINPDDRMATVNFHTVKPVSITDLVSGEKFLVSQQNSFEITVPTGLFRFLDVEIEGTL